MSNAPAVTPALNINELNFDTCERLRHLDWLLTQLGIGAGATVLDVGGYPCYMARAFTDRKVVTADMYDNGHAPYVKASGAALPFPDKAFNVTIACDVLEHVPAPFRESFLTELARVSAHAVIVAGPYTTPGTAKAETTVRELLPESSPAQMWLAEHAECGLPSMEDAITTFKGTGATQVSALPVGSLTEWMLFFAGQAASERDHRTAEAMKRFISQYNQLHINPGVANRAPAYRHAIVATKDAESSAQLERLAADATSGTNDKFDREQVECYVESLGALLKSVFESRTTGTSTEPGELDDVHREYVQRLESMLAHRGMPLPASTEAEPASMLPFSARLRNALRALRG